MYTDTQYLPFLIHPVPPWCVSDLAQRDLIRPAGVIAHVGRETAEDVDQYVFNVFYIGAGHAVDAGDMRYVDGGHHASAHAAHRKGDVGDALDLNAGHA